jgi:glycosyltransferase involved in cell wall biosynthesis
MSARIRIVHVINSFEYGGAEAMLCNLLLRTDRERFEPSVVSLIDDLTVAGPILRAGIPIVTMGMKPGVPNPLGVLRLAAHLRGARPAIVQTWMDHSNLIGGLAARMAACPRVVWGIHHSNHVPGVAKRSTLLTVGACAKLSGRVPSRIVCCSEHAASIYAARGFAADKLTVIPNGFDTDRFRPDAAARAELRRELGLAPDTPLIGLVARHDPFKDHPTFLRAAAILATSRPGTHFLLCGANVTTQNRALATLIDSLGLTRRCHLLGPRNDVPRINPALDVATSSSISEAFPLALGEAMACGTPCVATDVGDSALIIGPTGRIVPPSNPQALAAGWAELLALDLPARAKLSQAARDRIRELFDLDAVTRRYERLYVSLTSTQPRRPRPSPARPALIPQPACAN